MEPGQYLIYIDWVKKDLSDFRNTLVEFEKANEIYFRLGIIYKQQHKYPASLDCFRYILGHPPRPLTEVDIWFQIGHVYEQQKDVSSRLSDAALSHISAHLATVFVQYGAAKDAYERVLKDSPNHAKVLQQLGWLYHQGGASFANQELAINYLTKSLEAGKQFGLSRHLEACSSSPMST